MLARRNVSARKDRISFVQGDIGCLRTGSHAFDVVSAIAVLEYLANPVQTARALRGCLSERGILCVTWPSSRSVFRKIERFGSRSVAHLGRRSNRAALHSRDYVQYQSGVTAREWTRALTGAGLVLVERVGLPMGNRGWRLLARPSELVVFAAPGTPGSRPTGGTMDSSEA
jgi:2-polyprenyl-3-methyl-5-hydroxy-6-metoxy-1,4-benzoquinol methylase